MIQLLNNLIEANMVKAIYEVRALRCVDYEYYFDTESRLRGPDREFEVKRDMFYITTALNALQLRSGQKFLNIGSGIGYFNTVASLLLGRNGVNHGIEINERLLDLAQEKLAEFKLNSGAIDHFDFCEPVFIHGDACELLPIGYYDRVYCEAAIPHDKLMFMQSLIKIGGILLMPLDDCLWKVTRRDALRYRAVVTTKVIENAFSKFIVPERRSLNIVTFPLVKPLTLQELCRCTIRASLHEDLQKEIPEDKDCASGNDSKADSEAVTRDLTIYNFIRNYRANELSRCLKEEIYSLVIPTQLKHFLNYNRTD